MTGIRQRPAQRRPPKQMRREMFPDGNYSGSALNTVSIRGPWNADRYPGHRRHRRPLFQRQPLLPAPPMTAHGNGVERL
jgi:hypothetical protein